MILHLLAVLVAALVGLPLLPIYLVLRASLGRPPIVPRAAQLGGVFRLATGPLPEPGCTPRVRAILVAVLIRRALFAPAWGLAWFLDEALYGRALDAVELERPVFEIGAARSGSTQVARYLQEDSRLRSPSALQASFPFVWAWRLARATLGRIISRDRVRAFVEGQVPPEYLERHELDVFHTDTLEVLFYGFHLGDLVPHLGPDPVVEAMSPSALTATNRAFWLEDFVPYLERLGRKTLLADGPGRLFVKGHFLAVAPELARRHPDASFFTVVRDPRARIQSVINFHRYQPGEAGLPPIPWPWLIDRALRIEVPYDEAERAWYGAPDGQRRCVVAFEDYVADLGGTLHRIYAEVLEAPAPPLPATHAPRERTKYRIDRSLAELGVDVARVAPKYPAAGAK
jgi:hypothetical protein